MLTDQGGMSTPQIESKPSPRPGVPTMEKHRCFSVYVPTAKGHQEIDLTATITRAIAHELWQKFGGNSVINWLQAEAIVDHLADSIEGAQAPLPMAQTEAKPAVRQAA